MESKKQRKKHSLIEAAQALFEKNGFQNTSIDDIVKKADVAKGTFYLYFHDKFDIMDNVALNISCRVLTDAYNHMMANHQSGFVDNLICMIDFIVDYFTHNKLVLKLIEKNFSWPLVREQLDEEQDNQLKQLLDEFCRQDSLSGRSRDDVIKLIFLIIEACSSICFNAIIYEQPDTIDNMKPFLYDSIRKLLG